MYNKILVPTDGSTGAAAATEFARDLLGSGVARAVTLVHVASIAKEIAEYSIVNPKRVDEELVKAKLMQQGRKIVLQGKETFEQAGLQVETRVELCDDPGDRIVKLGLEYDFDLIVMGSRGLSIVKELILGSVSSKVLRKASCPVIIYRG